MAETLVAGRYRLVDLLGRGAMSEVWLAEDLELERRVALKLVAPNADRARFEREARAAASLAHENVMQLYDFGEASGRPFMVLEYLPGGTLEDRLSPDAPLADDESRRIATELAAGLAHAHARGLVHRDLKPANVLFDQEGRAKIADFGIARLEGGGTLTEAGTVLGTAAYISPEQAGGERASPASDVYAFGILLFRMLTGRLPFEATQPIDLLEKHRAEEPPRVRDVRAGAPFELAALADDALAKSPQSRPQDGTELLARLAPTTTAPSAEMPPPEGATQVIVPPRQPRRRLLVIALLAAAALAAGGIGAAYAITHTSSSPPPVTSAETTPAHTGTHAATTRATRTQAASISETHSATTSTTTAQHTTTSPSTPGTTTFLLPSTEPATTAAPTIDTSTTTDTTTFTDTVAPTTG